MSILEVLLIGVSLSMDAFAAALCKGLSMRKLNIKYGLIIALFFGGFQALMPLIGWLISSRFAQYIEKYDHWIAFGLLIIVGGKMIFDSIKERNEPDSDKPFKFNLGEILVLAIATSIDALAVGVSFGFLQINIWSSITLIGCVTLVLSFAGIIIGNLFGSRFKTKTEIAGGVVLILIGVKILLEHLGVISF